MYNIFENILSKGNTPGTSSLFNSVSSNPQITGNTGGGITPQSISKAKSTISVESQIKQKYGFNDKDIQFLRLAKEKGYDSQKAMEYLQNRKKTETQNIYKGEMSNPIMNFVGGAVAEVPNVLGQTTSFLGKLSQYEPTNLISTGIQAAFSDKTYGQLREEQKAQAEKFATAGQKGKEFVQKYGAYNPESFGAKAGEFGVDIGASLVGPNKVSLLSKGAKVIGAGKKLATTAKIGDIALEGGLAGAKYDIGTKGNITPESVAIGAVGNVGVAGVLKGGKVLANRYTGANISTRANRFTAGDEEKFIKMTGETPGQFATSRGMTAVGEDAVKQSSQLYKASMDKADEAISMIDGSFSTKGQADDILGDLMEGNLDKIKAQPRNPDATRVKELYNKYQSGQGLTMSEINEAKRIYARNHKFTWDQKASDAAVNATNLQKDLRSWQMKLAEESGLENLAEINKTTQAWKAFADSLEKRLDRSGANNLVSLSDWVALSGGNPTNIALFAGKKAFELPGVKSGAIKLFSKKTKPSIIEPTTEKVIKTNLQKKYANPNISADRGNISDKSLVRPAGLLPAPAKQTIQRKENVELSKKLLKEQQAKEAVTKQSDITSKSKIVRPSSVKPSPQVKPVEKTVIKPTEKKVETNITRNEAIEKGFSDSAKARWDKGDFTMKERGEATKYIKSNYKGKEYTIDGKKYKVDAIDNRNEQVRLIDIEGNIIRVKTNKLPETKVTDKDIFDYYNGRVQKGYKTVLSPQKTVKHLTEGKQSATMGDMETKKLIEELKIKPNSENYSKFTKSASDFISELRKNKGVYESAVSRTNFAGNLKAHDELIEVVKKSTDSKKLNILKEKWIKDLSGKTSPTTAFTIDLLRAIDEQLAKIK